MTIPESLEFRVIIKGSVFFSASTILLTNLISQIGIITTQEEKLMDLVGEVSNTIAGNARREFGDQFLLSVPIVFKRQK